MSLSPHEKEALKRFADLVQAELRDPGLRVLLFGSKARGDDRPGSDIDVLLIESSGNWRVADKVYEIATGIMLDTGVLISPKVISEARYKGLVRRGTPLAVSVARDGVPV